MGNHKSIRGRSSSTLPTSHRIRKSGGEAVMLLLLFAIVTVIYLLAPPREWLEKPSGRE
jgi:hypothetical protein